ncbi:MAG TPA: NUDIX hydrolase [Candidatus Saccharimonadales bacterium]|nr:NUDIX hydrolase [Candidatus Saccharimonadales bacterium]
MKKPDLVDEFIYEGDRISVKWYDVRNKSEIPDLPWQQIYVIGNYKNKVPIVLYENKGNNLPGGHVESGESLEMAMHREIKEELNMGVVSWVPLGYQRLSRPEDRDITFQFRVYAKLEKIGEFISDPGGSVIGHKLVELKDFNKSINYGKVGNRLIEQCSSYFN